MKSSPSDRATASRVTFQLLMEAADHSVQISTPYFLPDRALRRALSKPPAAASRSASSCRGEAPIRNGCVWPAAACGVSSSRRGSASSNTGDTMTHAKVFVADEIWSVLGTTNIDNRSFEHNDEVNLAMRDRSVAARLLEDYVRDIADSGEIPLERVAAAAAVGEDRRPVRVDSGAAAVSESKSASSVRRHPDRDLQHPSLPRHGSPDHAVARGRGDPRD